MLLMAHVHACALFIEPAEESDSAYFRRLNLSPIQAFFEEFSIRAELELKAGQAGGRYQKALALLEFPLKADAHFQDRLNTFHCGGGYEERSHTVDDKLDVPYCTLSRREISTLTI
jgi:hypothetical protein